MLENFDPSSTHVSQMGLRCHSTGRNRLVNKIDIELTKLPSGVHRKHDDSQDQFR